MRRKDERKYNAIINASIQQFMNEGFAKASISKIAKEADVSPATIYIYFDNKEDLINKLYLHLRKEMNEIVLGDIHLEGCLESAYKKMWFNYYNYCLNHHEAFDYIMQYTNSPHSKNAKTKYDLCYTNKIYEFFRLGKERGLIKQVSDEILFAYTFYPAAQLAKRHTCCGSKLCDLGVVNACDVAWDAVRNDGNGVECKKLNEDLIERLVKIFKKGEKKAEFLGVEFEHFLIDKNTLRSYEYFEKGGQLEISKGLVDLKWKTDYEENGNILALSKNGNVISYEPGGQFEISLRPCKTIHEVDLEYQKIMAEISTLLTEDQALVSLGYHPKTKIDELPLLPKERYKLMYEYLHQQGSMARNMMKGTASTQVSIDFESEEDFIKKYRVSNFLSPFIAKMFDASPIFEGEIYDNKNLRIDIWENTDISRCKLPEGVLSTTFNYASYAKYIAKIKPILMPAGDQTKYTGEQTVCDLSKSYYLSDKELDHATSMVFPDVRVKNFMEIRMADALPYPYNLAVPALIKGIFYNKELLDFYYNISLEYDDDKIIELNKLLKIHDDFEFECQHENISCNEFVFDMLERTMMVLDDDRHYLEKYYFWMKKNHSFSEYMKGIYGKPEFIDFLLGGPDVQN